MRIIALLVFSTLLSIPSFGWGPIGHRTIGLVAQQHLSKKTKRKLREILKHESLAVVSMWMDEERSNPNYKHMEDWHWVDIPDGKTYAESEKNPNGDAIQTINRLIDELESGTLSLEEEKINIKMLVHIIGDIHMPLHVGKTGDQGGNKVKVRFFGDETNLHTVWDSKIIDSKKFSYTELAAAIDHFDDESTIEKWQSDDVMVWVEESMSYRDLIYDLPEDKYIGYYYIYDAWPVIQERLHKAGVRLAGVLNKIYG
ncbi:S1/P1 nuclease [Fulvivirga lutea]|uniref:S1/P1 nuclease n=1 Tax=Fulvivirga lutea TaxID=2810512 RepID=A0A975A1W1_9BACT|nr:S1/P1 nuclease [Fulvivirga lutea]QSE98844.1 S1/P1 nuclease [Fulvivirga lutea]